MEQIIGAGDRLLEVDLSDRRVEVLSISEEDRWGFLGAKGLGLKLLAERLVPGIDPLGEKNWLIFVVGPLMGTGAPCSGRFSGLTKSPLTGIVAHTGCGGPFGMALKTAGFEGLLITGKASEPTVLVIEEEGVQFESAAQIWGLNTRQTQAALIKDNQSGVLAIGPAGENGVRYANIASGHRFLNRGGLGAVMGAKGLKAVVARGGRFQVVPKYPEEFKENERIAQAYISENLATGKLYPKFGTPYHVNWCKRNHIMPVNNFTSAGHKRAVNISGEAIAFTFKSHHQSCLSCRIQCGHATVTEDGEKRSLPDYDALVMLGPNLGIFDARRIITWNEVCGLLGMDPISAGGVLAWTMEAGAKGVIKSPIAFEAPQGIAHALEEIAHRQGLGAEQAKGTRYLADTYGGKEYAMQVKGMELSPYDPRGAWGQGLAYAVANRGGCYRSAPLFALEAGLELLPACSARSKAHWVFFLENLFAGMDALHTCQLTAFAYLMQSSGIVKAPRKVLALAMEHLPALSASLLDVDLYAQFFSSVTGYDCSQRDFLKAGERIHVLERWLNTREGIDRRHDTLPQRFLTESRKDDPDRYTVPLDLMLEEYYPKRGYDSNGIPTLKTLKALDLLEITAEAVETESVEKSHSIRAVAAEDPREEIFVRKRSPASTDAVKTPPMQAAPPLGPKSDDDLAAEATYSFLRPAVNSSPNTFPYRLVTPDISAVTRYWIMGGLWVFAKGLAAAYFADQSIRKEFDDLPHDFIFALAVRPGGPYAVIGKGLKGTPRFLGVNTDGVELDLVLQVKCLKMIRDRFLSSQKKMELFTGQNVIVKGDMAAACRVVRMSERATVYLLPGPLARKVVSDYPPLNYWRRSLGRLLIAMRILLGI